MKRVVVLLLVLLLAACQTNAASPAPSSTPRPSEPTAPPDPTAPPQVDSAFGKDVVIPNEGAAHTDEGAVIEYQNDPPASGTHYPFWLEYGIYEGEDVPPGYWVHNLEHGAVVILYKCEEACPDLVQQLGDLLDQFRLSKFDNRKIVIVPYSTMDVPLMAVAWDVQMPLDEFDAQALLDFYDRHVDQGPEDIP